MKARAPLPEDVRMAEARERSARINLEAERQRLARSDSLWVRNYITASDMEASRTRYELRRSDFEIAVETLNAVRQGPSPAQIREAEAEANAVEASLVMARHRLELDQETLARATLRAPKDGVVVRVDLHPGMVADQGGIVMVLATDKSPVLRAWVKEMNVWKVKQGQPVEILSNVFSDRERFLSRGEVVQTYPYGVSDGGERTFGVMVKFKESVIPPPLGSTADARIIVGRRGILKILLGIEDNMDQYIRKDGSKPPEVVGERAAGREAGQALR